VHCQYPIVRQRWCSAASRAEWTTNSTEHHRSSANPRMSKQHQDDELNKLIAWFDERDPEAEALLKDMADRLFIRTSLERLWQQEPGTHQHPET
jgi:hypothetical protein